jgi:hypothetical protein
MIQRVPAWNNLLEGYPRNCIEATNSPFERGTRNSTNGPFRNSSHKPYIYVTRTIGLTDLVSSYRF